MSRNVNQRAGARHAPGACRSTGTCPSGTSPAAPRAAEPTSRLPMRVGSTCPQFGRAIATGGIERAATPGRRAGVRRRVGERPPCRPGRSVLPVAVPVRPSDGPGFRGGGTGAVGVGTSVLVATQYTSPLAVANTSGQPGPSERRPVDGGGRDRLVTGGVRGPGRPFRTTGAAGWRRSSPCGERPGTTIPPTTTATSTRSTDARPAPSRPTRSPCGWAGPARRPCERAVRLARRLPRHRRGAAWRRLPGGAHPEGPAG